MSRRCVAADVGAARRASRCRRAAGIGRRRMRSGRRGGDTDFAGVVAAPQPVPVADGAASGFGSGTCVRSERYAGALRQRCALRRIGRRGCGVALRRVRGGRNRVLHRANVRFACRPHPLVDGGRGHDRRERQRNRPARPTCFRVVGRRQLTHRRAPSDASVGASSAGAASPPGNAASTRSGSRCTRRA